LILAKIRSYGYDRTYGISCRPPLSETGKFLSENFSANVRSISYFTSFVILGYCLATGAQVRVLRINDFLALFIAQRTDYVNNKVTIARTSTLQIGPTVYFGGLPQGVTLPNSVVDLAVC